MKTIIIAVIALIPYFDVFSENNSMESSSLNNECEWSILYKNTPNDQKCETDYCAIPYLIEKNCYCPVNLSNPFDLEESSNVDEESADVDEESSNVDEESANVDEESANVDEESANVDEESSNVDEESANADEESSNVDEESANAGEESSNVDEKSSNVDEKSSNVDEKSANVDEESSNVDEESANAGEESSNVEKDVDKNTLKKNTKSAIVGIAGGASLFSQKFYGNGYSLRPNNNFILRVNRLYKLNDNYESGITLITQLNSKAKHNYQSFGGGVATLYVNTKFHSTSILATGRYLGEQYGNFIPYLSASIGLAINSLYESHSEVYALSRYHAKTLLQPSFGVGAGTKYTITPYSSIVAEYQYLDSGKLKSNGKVSTGSSKYDDQIKYNLRQHIVFVGVEIKL